MSQDWNDLAGRLRASLALANPPIAISFRSGPVDGVAPFDAPMPEPLPDGRTGRVPAGCVFWMHAAESTFGTVAEDDQIVSQPQQGSRERCWIRRAREGDHALAPRLGRDLLEPGHQSAQIILEAADFGRIEIAREPRQELREDVRHPV